MPNIYHITHHRNLALILGSGGLLCDRLCQQAQAQNQQIGYAHIKQRRMLRQVPLAPFGTLGDYVPFYFAPRSPMLYTIDKRNTPDYQDGQQPIVHLVTSTEIVAATTPRLPWLFTDGHADISYSAFFNDFANLTTIDWTVMASRMWADTSADGDRKRRRQAEFLVHRFVPWSCIRKIAVIDDVTAQLVSTYLNTATPQPEITVERNWYY